MAALKQITHKGIPIAEYATTYIVAGTSFPKFISGSQILDEKKLTEFIDMMESHFKGQLQDDFKKLLRL